MYNLRSHVLMKSIETCLLWLLELLMSHLIENLTQLFKRKRERSEQRRLTLSNRHLVSRSLYWNFLPARLPMATNCHWGNNILYCFQLPSSLDRSCCWVSLTATADCCQMILAAPVIAYQCMHPHLPLDTKAGASLDVCCASATCTRLSSSFYLEIKSIWN